MRRGGPGLPRQQLANIGADTRRHQPLANARPRALHHSPASPAACPALQEYEPDARPMSQASPLPLPCPAAHLHSSLPSLACRTFPCWQLAAGISPPLCGAARRLADLC